MINDKNNKPSAEITEICCIFHQRNMLCQQRDSLRQKYKYLQDIKRAIQVRQNFPASEVYKDTKLMTKVQRSVYVKEYKKRNPVPKRFAKTSLSDMKLTLLEAESALCDAKIKIMKHIHKYDKRLRKLNECVEYSVLYSSGIVVDISFVWCDDDDDVLSMPSAGWRGIQEHLLSVNKTEIKNIHDEYYANKAIDKMLSK